MTGLRKHMETLKQRLKVDLLRELGRQYPVFCFIMLCLLLSTVLLNRYLLQEFNLIKEYNVMLTYKCLLYVTVFYNNSLNKWCGKNDACKIYIFSFQISSHFDGFLVVFGWRCCILLFPWPRVSTAKYFIYNKTEDEGKYLYILIKLQYLLMTN